MIKAAIFDVDGTLVDSNELHARSWQQTFREVGGRDVPLEEIRPQIGKGGDQLVPVFFPGEENARLRRKIDEYKTDLFLREYLPRVKVFPCVRPLFERLRQQGTRAVLATSAKDEELKAYHRILNIDDLVDGETSSGDAERSKPCPDIFSAALEKLDGIGRHEAVVIGDSTWDAVAATRIGLWVVGLLCGGFSEESLRKAGACAVYGDPCDLLAQLAESPLGTRKAA